MDAEVDLEAGGEEMGVVMELMVVNVVGVVVVDLGVDADADVGIIDTVT